MTFEDRLDAPPVAPQLAPDAAVGMLADRLPVGERENIGEEHVVVVSSWLEDEHVLVGIPGLVSGEADAHPRVDHGAKGLRQHRGQATVDELAASHDPEVDRADGVDGNYGVHAQDQVRSVVEGDRGVDCLEQNTVDIVAAVDEDRRVEAREGRGGLNRGRDRHVIEAGLAESHRSARVEVRGYQYQLLSQAAEVVGSAVHGEDLLQVGPDGFVLEDSYWQGPRQPGHGFEETDVSGVRQDLPEGLH